MNKKLRQQVFEKTKGRCAYCGCKLGESWHVDHIVPVRRNPDGSYYGKGTDDITNLLPACPSCNIMKGSFSLEAFRYYVENLYNSVAYHNVVNIAERYGIVERHKKKIVFYFEKIKEYKK